METANPHPKKVHLISLGCARNRVDSEVVLGDLLTRGWAHVDAPETADAIVVNTCGFIGPAKEESIQTILDSASYKEKNPNLQLVVAGCLTQRYKNQLAQGLPEVDLFIGTDQFPHLASILNEERPFPENRILAKRSNYLMDGLVNKKNTLSPASAYVKVAEGCQHQCAFCIIPAIRGKLRSRGMDDIVKEIQNLTEQGVLEINLIAQDLAAYGRDQGRSDVIPLLKTLCRETDVQWIRMLYMYPEMIEPELIECLVQEPKLLSYLDIPMQHGSDRILKWMRRQTSAEQILSVLDALRSQVPEMVIRTSLMVGFPGETEEDFQILRDFVQQIAVDHLGCFSYSKEEGTVAARLPNQVEEETKQRRLETIMQDQQKISEHKLKKYVGQTLQVLVEKESPEHPGVLEGRAFFQAPEVDGKIYFSTESPDQKYGFRQVRVEKSYAYDLSGEEVLVDTI